MRGVNESAICIEDILLRRVVIDPDVVWQIILILVELVNGETRRDGGLRRHVFAFRHDGEEEDEGGQIVPAESRWGTSAAAEVGGDEVSSF